MKLPPPQHGLVTLIDKRHAETAAGGRPRAHMGASLLGHPCDRWLWLSFRWAVRERLEGRTVRLFRRGHREEETILADLKMAGVTIVDTQARAQLGGHVSGSIDAVVKGVPEAPQTLHVAEFKTHNAKSFAALEKDGVEKSKPMHWAQMQSYMHATGIDRALYVAICKDDDRYYVERVRYDREAALAIIERGRRISEADRMPEPVPGAGPAWYQCKMCAAHHFCHVQTLTNQVNCRTCAHYTARPDGTSHCAAWDATIPVDAQHEGCPRHVIHPDLTPWQVEPSEDGLTAIYVIDGQRVRNGEGGVSSADLINREMVPF